MRIDFETCNDIDLVKRECGRLTRVVESLVELKEEQTSREEKLVEALENIRAYILSAECDSTFESTRTKLITRIKYLTQAALTSIKGRSYDAVD